MGATQSAFDYEGQLLGDKVVQSVAIGYGDADTDHFEYSEIRRCIGYEDNLMQCPNEGTENEVRTMWEALSKSAKRFPTKDCFGTRCFDEDSKGAFKWQTFQQIYDQAVAIGSGLVASGLESRNNVGIFAPNRAEWMISAYGIYSQNMRVIALYTTLGPDAVEYIVNHSELSTIFVSKDNMNDVLSIAEKTKLKLIVQFDVDVEKYANPKESIYEEHISKAKSLGIELIGFSDLIRKGKSAKNAPNPPASDDIGYIMYTSGTTGNPKGASLAHACVMSAVAGVESQIRVYETDVHFSYLPLAHIFETDVQIAIMVAGGKVGFWQGNIKKMTEDLQALKPTVLAGVPRVFTRIYQTVMAGVGQAGCPKRSLFRHAYNSQLDNVRNGSKRSNFYDSKIFGPIASRVGLENCRIIVSGAAPLPPYLMEFLRVVFKCAVVQGYGLTETAAGLSISLPSDLNSGHCGPPIPSAEIRLKSVPEMDYKVTDDLPRGEILVRGPTVFKGYFKNEKATSECFDKYGFFMTGDIGRINANGTISVIDRKKNIFKLSQGEYVASERVENTYGKSPYVAQFWVYGNSFKSFIVAVVVPNSETFIKIGQEKGWYTGPSFGHSDYPKAFNQMWKDHYDDLKLILLDALAEQQHTLKGFEKVKDIIVEYDVNQLGLGFTEENQCMTPTFKLRGPFLLKRYRQKLRDLYAKNGEPPQADEKWPGE